MLKNIIIAITIGIIISSCGISADKPKPITSADTLGITKDFIEAASTLPDTSNQDIYNFMKIVISERKLDTTFGLATEAEERCNSSIDDSVFLQTLLIEQINQGTEAKGMDNNVISLNEMPRCLTKKDIRSMLKQKKEVSGFVWDNSRLGFNINNHKNWYSFSVPLFSYDKKTAVMMVSRLCPGLCGVGNTLIFRNKNGKWTSSDAAWWIH